MDFGRSAPEKRARSFLAHRCTRVITSVHPSRWISTGAQDKTPSEARYGTGRTQTNLLAQTPYEDSRRPWHQDYACSRRSHIHWTTSYLTTYTSCSLSVARAPCRRNTNATSKPKARRQELQGGNQSARPVLHTAVPHAHARIRIHGQSHTYIPSLPRSP